MFAEERRQKIWELLQKQQRVLAKELADMFGVSVDSIRRDLSIMEEQGLLKKTHGGAIPISKVRTLPPPLALRYGKASPYNHAIAKMAASYIQEGDTVFIGSASIHDCMIQYLPKNTSFTVVTHSIRIADALRENEYVDTYLIGGRVKPSGSITDTLAAEFVGQFTFDLCFATGGGISERGISTASPEVAGFGRAVCEVSRRIIGLAPHEKLGIDCFAKMIPIQRIDQVITDEEADQDAVRKLTNQGIKVIMVNAEEE